MYQEDLKDKYSSMKLELASYIDLVSRLLPPNNYDFNISLIILIFLMIVNNNLLIRANFGLIILCLILKLWLNVCIVGSF